MKARSNHREAFAGRLSGLPLAGVVTAQGPYNCTEAEAIAARLYEARAPRRKRALPASPRRFSWENSQ